MRGILPACDSAGWSKMDCCRERLANRPASAAEPASRRLPFQSGRAVGGEFPFRGRCGNSLMIAFPRDGRTVIVCFGSCNRGRDRCAPGRENITRGPRSPIGRGGGFRIRSVQVRLLPGSLQEVRGSGRYASGEATRLSTGGPRWAHAGSSPVRPAWFGFDCEGALPLPLSDIRRRTTVPWTPRVGGCAHNADGEGSSPSASFPSAAVRRHAPGSGRRVSRHGFER